MTLPFLSFPSRVFGSAILGSWFVLACSTAWDGDEDDDREWTTLTFQQGMSGYSGATDGTSADSARVVRWSLDGIPSGARVRDVTLTLHALGDGAFERSTVHLLKGSSRGPAVGSVVGLGRVSVELDQAGVAAIQGWLDDPSGNSGLAIVAAGGSGDAFATSTHEDVLLRPALAVSYYADPTNDEPAPRPLSAAGRGPGSTGTRW